MIAEINTTRTIILTIVTSATTISVNHREKSVIFVVKKIITLTNI